MPKRSRAPQGFAIYLYVIFYPRLEDGERVCSMNFNGLIIPQERGSIGKGSTAYSTFTHSRKDEKSCIIISIRMDGKCLWTAIFRSLRCYGAWQIKSGLLPGHSRTGRDLFRSHSSIVLSVCFRSLLNQGHWHIMFCSRTFLYLAHSSFPQFWPVCLSLLLRITPIAWCWHNVSL